VIWFAVVAPVAHAHTVSFGPRLIATAYPVADNLLMLALIQLVVARGFRPAALRYLVGAFALIFATDIVYARTRVSATFTPGSWLNAGYLLFYVLLGCAFLSPSIGQVLPLRPEPALTVSRIRLGSLVVPLLIAPILVAVGAGRDPVQARILAGGCALISLLVFARLVLVFKERDAFNRDRLEAHEELAQMAYRDPLTGLANRTALYDSVDCAVQEARATQRAVAILFLDLDRFKAVNDLYGHASGDEVLRDVASRLKVALRETDLVARHGGDEFVVAMPGLPIEQAPALAAAVTARIEAEFVLPFEIGEQRHQLGITSGFSVYPADGSTTAELVEAADRAMYTRKPLDVAVPAELGV
jgi:diguanylate cyclase (GGDEF)-like protein